jgi:organic hydroperoxide reductase OsmC/OhrA
MSTYVAETRWSRAGTGERDFAGRYSRRHVLRFDGGAEGRGIVLDPQRSPPWSDEAAVDPEEAFIAALSGCHMLFFLSFAAKSRFCVDAYVDAADGVCADDERGKVSMTVVTLRPRVEFSGERRPTRADVEQLHHAAHEACYIANSVRTDVRCEPVWTGSEH